MVHIFLLNHLSCSPAEWRKKLPVVWSSWDRSTEIITYVLRIINLLYLIDWSRIFPLIPFLALLNLRSIEWTMAEMSSQLLLFIVLLAFLCLNSLRLTWMKWRTNNALSRALASLQKQNYFWSFHIALSPFNYLLILSSSNVCNYAIKTTTKSFIMLVIEMHQDSAYKIYCMKIPLMF